MNEIFSIKVPEFTRDEIALIKYLNNIFQQVLNTHLEKPMTNEVVSDKAVPESTETKGIDFSPLEKKFAELTSFMIDTYGLNVNAVQSLGINLIYDLAEGGVKMRFALQEIPRATSVKF